jgi:hypothetical protein
LLSISLALWVVYPRITAAEHRGLGDPRPTHLPWTFADVIPRAELEVTLPLHWGSPSRWHIWPDDILTALQINGRAVPLNVAHPESGLRDWLHGFDIDLGPWLHRGDNLIEMAVTNTGGLGGISMRPLLGWRPLLLAAGVMPWLWVLARGFRLGRMETVILAVALVVVCWYWGATPWYERNYDVKRYGLEGHLDYVIYLVEHRSLPPVYEGWQYYQPPGYYGIGALAWRWADWLGISGPEALQAYSLVLWQVFLTSSVAAMKRILRRPAWVLGTATAALALWPSGIISAIRIGNDAGLYAAAGLATYFMVRWWKGQGRRHLAGMALSVAAAFLFKGSGMALLAAAGALVALRLLRRARWRRLRPWLEASAAAAAMGSGVALGMARNVWAWKEGKTPSWLISNIAGLDDDLKAPSGLRSFIPLDVPVFLCEPWVNSRDDATGRANFWNYFLRSSLSGEFSFEGKLHEVLSLAWGVLLLWLVAILLVRPFVARPSVAALWRDAPVYAVGLLWLASAISLRASFDFACEADFRFVVPAIVPFVAACARERWVAPGLLAIIAASSVVFFVSL